jgi:amidophosphoribosyltransferase
VLGKYVLEGRGQLPLPVLEEERAVSGWTGRQAGSATVPGGAEDALSRP